MFSRGPIREFGATLGGLFVRKCKPAWNPEDNTFEDVFVASASTSIQPIASTGIALSAQAPMRERQFQPALHLELITFGCGERKLPLDYSRILEMMCWRGNHYASREIVQ